MSRFAESNSLLGVQLLPDGYYKSKVKSLFELERNAGDKTGRQGQKTSTNVTNKNFWKRADVKGIVARSKLPAGYKMEARIVKYDDEKFNALKNEEKERIKECNFHLRRLSHG